MNVVDIRQSDQWSEYLKMYNWKSYRLSSGVVFRVSKTGPLVFGKLHRPENINDSVLTELHDTALKYKVTSLKISPTPSNNLNSLANAGFKECRSIDLPPRTIFIDLSCGEGVLWDHFLPTCRRAINRARTDSNKVEIIQNPNRKTVEEYYKIVSSRGHKKGYYVQSLNDQVRKIEVFKDKSFIINVYSKEGLILGTKMFLGFKDAIWYMHGGITNEGQKSSSGYLLVWNSLKHFMRLGYKVFDFEGLSDSRLKHLTNSWQGYSDFKLKFGGTIIEFPLPYLKYYRFLSPLNVL
jgi:lipid II:glycine glycyltransferase (peptidoglycan interpeptide bridge formation enzyme)